MTTPEMLESLDQAIRTLHELRVKHNLADGADLPWRKLYDAQKYLDAQYQQVFEDEGPEESQIAQCHDCRCWMLAEQMERSFNDRLCPECYAKGDPQPEAGDRFYDAISESRRAIAKEVNSCL